MQVTEVIVSAGRTFNHPYESYSNLRPMVTVKARLGPDEDPTKAINQLQALAEKTVEDSQAGPSPFTRGATFPFGGPARYDDAGRADHCLADAPGSDQAEAPGIATCPTAGSAVIKTNRGDAFKASCTAGPWHALEAASRKWAEAKMREVLNGREK